jgi:putative DNA primase/helicase
MTFENVTILRAVAKRLAKRWTSPTEVADFDQALNYRHEQRTVSTPRELAALLEELQGDEHAAIIRGGYIGDELAVPIMQRVEHYTVGCVVRQKAVFKDRRSHLFMADVDDWTPGTADPIREPEAAIAEWVASELPDDFQGISYTWQLSGSAGAPKNAGKLKAHVWFMLETPYTSAELRAWVTAKLPSVDAALFDEIQLHYVAAPVFAPGVADPVPRRFGFAEGLCGDFVPLKIETNLPTMRLERAAVLSEAVANDPIVKRLRERGLVLSARSDGALNIRCPRADQHSGESTESSTVYYPAHTGGFAQGNFKCLHAHCRDQPKQTFIEALGFDATEGFVDETTARGLERSDLLLGRKLADMLAGRFLFEHGGRGWLQYVGGAWVTCAKGEAREEAKKLGIQLLRDHASAGKLDSDKAARMLKLVERAMSSAGISAALTMCETDPRISARPGEFDTDPDLLNVANGVLHLPTGELRPHDPALRLSRQCPVAYDCGAIAPRFHQFLREVSCNDDEWIDFLARATGYTLCGHVREEVMMFALGFGANGKSVYANVMRSIMGTYATIVSANFLSLSNRDGEAATPSLAMLPGARLALANEVEAGCRLSAQVVKVAVSTEAISARHLYGSVFSYIPTHKLWVRANHRPIITDTDDGIWRRIVLIPFDRRFEPHERDMHLEEKLITAEAPGILNWMVRGFAEYRRRGLKPTGRIAAASAAYREESDLMGQWLDESAVVEPSAEVLQDQAFAEYRSWCERQGVRAVSKKSFTVNLRERGFKDHQQTSGTRRRVYRGFRLPCNF